MADEDSDFTRRVLLSCKTLETAIA